MHGSKLYDDFERSAYSRIDPEAAQGDISECIFHKADCSKLLHESELTLNHAFCIQSREMICTPSFYIRLVALKIA
jgi:hypothetical protein